MDKVAKGMSEAGRQAAGSYWNGENEERGIVQSVKDLAKMAVGKVRDYMKGSSQLVRR